MAKNVIIVGAPRSGTSMTANIFIKKGYHVTDDETENLQTANEFNPHGYWESAALRRCNEEIFNLVGYHYPNTWLQTSISDTQANAILSLDHKSKHRDFVDSFRDQQPWLWKDPSLCYTIGYWWPLIDSSTTRIIFARRNSNDVCNSFVRVNWCKNTHEGKSEALLKINRHVNFAKQVLDSHNIPYLEVDYSDYEKNGEKVARSISDYFDLNISEKELAYDKYLNSSKSIKRRATWILKSISPSPVKKLLKKLVPRRFYT